MPNCGREASKFELQSRYYVHFRTNTLGKGMNPLISPAMSYSTTAIILKGCPWHYITLERWYTIKTTQKQNRLHCMNIPYGYITLTLITIRLEKKLDGNFTMMLRAILSKSWKQHPTKLKLCGYLPPISQTIQVKQTRHARYCW